MKKKLLCVMLSTAMVAALLAGCTKTPAPTSEPTSTSEVIVETSEVVEELTKVEANRDAAIAYVTENVPEECTFVAGTEDDGVVVYEFASAARELGFKVYYVEPGEDAEEDFEPYFYDDYSDAVVALYQDDFEAAVSEFADANKDKEGFSCEIAGPGIANIEGADVDSFAELLNKCNEIVAPELEYHKETEILMLTLKTDDMITNPALFYATGSINDVTNAVKAEVDAKVKNDAEMLASNEALLKELKIDDENLAKDLVVYFYEPIKEAEYDAETKIMLITLPDGAQYKADLNKYDHETFDEVENDWCQYIEGGEETSVEEDAEVKEEAPAEETEKTETEEVVEEKK